MRVRFNAQLVKLSKARGDDYIINLISATCPEEVQEFHAHMILRMHEMHPHGARGYFQPNTRMLLSRTTNILVNHQPHGHSSVAMLFYRPGLHVGLHPSLRVLHIAQNLLKKTCLS